MIHLWLTDAQQRELEAVSRQAIGRVALRAHMVLLAGRGYSVPQIATIHACGTDVVRTWLHRYAQQGVAGLEDHPRSGRPPKDQLAGPIVDAQVSQSPRCSGHVQACWSVALLAAFLARRFRLLLSRSSVRRSLHHMGWRWARPRLAPARRSDVGSRPSLVAPPRASPSTRPTGDTGPSASGAVSRPLCLQTPWKAVSPLSSCAPAASSRRSPPIRSSCRSPRNSRAFLMVMCLEGRLVLPYTGYDRHVALLQQGARIGAAKLWYASPRKQVYLLVSLAFE